MQQEEGKKRSRRSKDEGEEGLTNKKRQHEKGKSWGSGCLKHKRLPISTVKSHGRNKTHCGPKPFLPQDGAALPEP